MKLPKTPEGGFKYISDLILHQFMFSGEILLLGFSVTSRVLMFSLMHALVQVYSNLLLQSFKL